MNFALTDEQVLLREAARGALSRFKTVEAAREALENPEALPDLWPTAVEAGWPGLLIREDRGGAGLGVFDAMLVADQPEKIQVDHDIPSLRIGPQLRQVMDAAQREVLVISPYFVPGNTGAQYLSDLARRGMYAVEPPVGREQPVAFLEAIAQMLRTLQVWALQRQLELQKKIQNPVPLYGDVRELLLEKCKRANRQQMRAIFGGLALAIAALSLVATFVYMLHRFLSMDEKDHDK